MGESTPDARCGGTTGMIVDRIYGRRFTDAEEEAKEELWREIAPFLQRYVRPSDTVLDLACDRGFFIRHIVAAEKVATDVRDVSSYLPPDVRFVQVNGLELDAAIDPQSVDVVFMSNYLEHLDSSDQVIRQLEVAHSVLRSGGRVVVLQPNVRLVGGAYWDFIDHKVALTEHSLVEAAELAGFTTVEVIARFLPYTTKSRLPQSRRLVRTYLKFRPAWRVLGKQTLYVGRRD
jgi:SAM-dependent methyltransferase